MRHPYTDSTEPAHLVEHESDYNHVPVYEDDSLREQIRDVIGLLNSRLRPLTGHVNTHAVGGDVVSFASYNLTANADPVQIVGNLPHGIMAEVLINANASCHITTSRDSALSNAFRIPANTVVRLPVASDIWLFTDTGTPFVSVAVISYDLPA